jgi:hypothetical protein
MHEHFSGMLRDAIIFIDQYKLDEIRKQLAKERPSQCSETKMVSGCIMMPDKEPNDDSTAGQLLHHARMFETPRKTNCSSRETPRQTHCSSHEKHGKPTMHLLQSLFITLIIVRMCRATHDARGAVV